MTQAEETGRIFVGRQREMARLEVAMDAEIADELVIAVRTVTIHVGNILNKTVAANRAEAASYANQRGLVIPDSDVSC